MDIKYLSDAKGTITGVFIPLADWQQLQRDYHIALPVAAESNAQLRQELTDALKKSPPEPGE